MRVALVDDHQPFRERLRALLTRDRDIDIVAEATSGQALLDLARTTELDVACMDIRLPGMSGIEATRRLLAITPGVRVIGLSAYAEPHYVEAMLGAGAVGHFTKGDVGEALLQAIHTATREHPCFGADIVVPGVANGTAPTVPDGAPANPDAAPLGVRELEVLGLIAKGTATPQIARTLSMDPGMVEVYRRNIMRKAKVTTDAALGEYARGWSLRRDRSK